MVDHVFCCSTIHLRQLLSVSHHIKNIKNHKFAATFVKQDFVISVLSTLKFPPNKIKHFHFRPYSRISIYCWNSCLSLNVSLHKTSLYNNNFNCLFSFLQSVQLWCATNATVNTIHGAVIPSIRTPWEWWIAAWNNISNICLVWNPPYAANPPRRVRTCLNYLFLLIPKYIKIFPSFFHNIFLYSFW